MILNTGNRTDIPAFYTPWFMNRVKSGEVLVRSPYAENQVTRYRLDPSVVDLLVFCTKNPYPILPHLKSLSIFYTFWHVTITPYGRDIEPNVPSKRDILSAFQYLSHQIGANRIVWRYDPILINHTYTTAYHIEAFRSMAETLQGYTHQVVISFIDLYEKTKRNFPEARPVSAHDQVLLVNAFSEIAKKTGLAIHLCCESAILERDNVDANGCLSQAVLEEALGEKLSVPRRKAPREGCTCLLGADIGAYNTCSHFCRYCYANYDEALVRKNYQRHDPASALLIGHLEQGDIIKDAQQKSWKSPEISLF